MKGFVPPAPVLAALCEQLGDCRVVESRIVVDERPREPTDALSRSEFVMVDVFRRFGPVLTFQDVRDRCVDAGLCEQTAIIQLGNSPIFRRVAPSVYTLIGATVSADEIGSMSKKTSIGRGLSESTFPTR